jgi:hypothetical protein
MLVAGKENLGIMLWASETQQDMEVVLEILAEVNINSRRLVHKFDPR